MKPLRQIALLGLVLPAAVAAHEAATPTGAQPEKDHQIMQAEGAFNVALTPQSLTHKDDDGRLGRMSIDKTFRGDLEGTSKGEMLTAMTAVKGSAGYVAIERVDGVLHGRVGTFVLQHSGTMSRGEPSSRVTVVPDSGTGELDGLAGEMTIHIADGKHTYTFEYTLPAQP